MGTTVSSTRTKAIYMYSYREFCITFAIIFCDLYQLLALMNESQCMTYTNSCKFYRLIDRLSFYKGINLDCTDARHTHTLLDLKDWSKAYVAARPNTVREGTSALSRWKLSTLMLLLYFQFLISWMLFACEWYNNNYMIRSTDPSNFRQYYNKISDINIIFKPCLFNK